MERLGASRNVETVLSISFLAARGPLLTIYRRWMSSSVAFIVFLTDLEYSVATGSAQFVMLSDMDLDLPASEFVWSAENAFEWHTRSLSCSNHPPLSFLAAVRALMAPNPEPFSEHSIILAELCLLSSFSLLILSRMLSYTEKKCEEALQQTDPFKHLRTFPSYFCPLSEKS